MLTQTLTRCGSGVYSYLEPSLADRHAVSTTSSPYRVMLACEVNLLPPRVQPPKFSGIAQSVSYSTYHSGITPTLSISSTRMGRRSSCQQLRRSSPSISYSTPNLQIPHPRDPVRHSTVEIPFPRIQPRPARRFACVTFTFRIILLQNRRVVSDSPHRRRPPPRSVIYI